MWRVLWLVRVLLLPPRLVWVLRVLPLVVLVMLVTRLVWRLVELVLLLRRQLRRRLQQLTVLLLLLSGGEREGRAMPTPRGLARSLRASGNRSAREVLYPLQECFHRLATLPLPLKNPPGSDGAASSANSGGGREASDRRAVLSASHSPPKDERLEKRWTESRKLAPGGFVGAAGRPAR